MRKQNILILLLFFLIASFFFYPIFKGNIPFPGDSLMSLTPFNSYSYLGFAPGGIPSKAIGDDVIRILYPWKYFVIEQLKQGQIPFWNPYDFSGNTFFANLQSGPFSPFNVLFLTLPFTVAWTFYIFLEEVLLGIFTYIFLKQNKLSNFSSFLGGVVASYSAFTVVWLEYGTMPGTFLWLPLALTIVLLYFRKPDIKKLVYLTVTLFVALISGHIQLAIYVYLTVFLYGTFLFFLEKKQRAMLKKYIFFCIPFLFSLCLGAIQLLPLYEIFVNSARGAYTFADLSQRLIPVVNLVTVVIPDFFGNPTTRNYWLNGTYIERAGYIGMIPFLLAFFVWFGKKNPHALFFFFLGVLSYFSTLDILPVKLFHAMGIPVISTTVPSRILSIYCFAFSIAAAFGFEQWQKEKERKKTLRILAVFAILFVGIWAFVFLQKDPNFAVTKRNLLIPTGLLVVGGIVLLQKIIPKKTTVVLLLVITIFDLFYFFHKVTPFSPKAFVYPKADIFTKLAQIQGINRYWGYGSAAIPSVINLPYHIYSTEGYDPLFIKRYAELISVTADGKIPTVIPRSDVNITPGYGPSDLKNNYYRQRIMDLLGVKYVLQKTSPSDKPTPDYSTFSDHIFSLIYQQGMFQIYQNNEALPRVFLAGNYVVKSNKQTILKTILDKHIDLRNTIILEEKPDSSFSPKKDREARVNVVSYQPNTVVLQTNSSNDQLLFLSDNYFPGWKVTVDGKARTIYRADYAFRAVPVVKGKHTVVFSYYPQSFATGMKISLIAALVLVGLFFFTKKKIV